MLSLHAGSCCSPSTLDFVHFDQRLLFRPLRQTSNEACKPIESSSSKTSSPADSQPVSTDLQTTSNQMPTLECAVATANGTNLSEDVSKEETKRTLLEGTTSSQYSSLPEEERLLPKKKPSQAASAGATSVVEEPMETNDMPYFPSHPFSIFPPDTTAAVTMEATPHQLAPMEEGHFCGLVEGNQEIPVLQYPHSWPSNTTIVTCSSTLHSRSDNSCGGGLGTRG